MAYDIFLKIDGIDGESMDDKHKNEIEVLSWRWNIHQESTMHAGSGLGSGKVSVTNPSLNITSIAPARICSNTAPPVSIFRSPSLSCVKQAAIHWNTSSTPLLT